MIRLFFLSFLLYFFSVRSSFGFQDGKLFKTDDPLPIEMAFSVKDLKKTTNDSTFLNSYLLVESTPGSYDSIPMKMRTRGNFRLDHCYYPPIKLKFKKKHVKGTVFQKNTSLKLVMPCQRNKGADSFIGKEFLAYQLLEDITPYYFETRLVKVKFTNLDDKKAEEIELLGFLIQEDEKVAKRFEGKVLEERKIPPSFMQDTATVRQDFFQFMIGNTDFSTLFLHNQKVLQLSDETIVPLSYDFDMSGLVNPPYALVNAQLGLKSITDRLYRGFCRDEVFLEMIRQEFLIKEDVFWTTVDRQHPYISEIDMKSARGFLKEFFDVLKSDRLFQDKILQACR